MNIAFFTHYTELYGANRSLINLISGLTAYGHKAIVFSPDFGEVTDFLSQREIMCYIVPFQKSFNNFPLDEQIIARRIENNSNCIGPIVSTCINNQIDLIYSNSSVFDIGLLVSKIIKKPHIWHFREFGDIDYQVYPDIGKKLFERLINLTDGLLFVSNSLKNYILKQDNSNSKVIYNGVISQSELETNTVRWLNKKIITQNFIMMGLVTRSKGQDKAVEAFVQVLKKYPNAKLKIAGGYEVEWIKKIILDLDLQSNVQVLGYISKPYDLYNQSDISLMCSPYEAMGRVTVESMAYGVPVIGYNSGGTPELITHGYNGFLYNGSVDDLAKKMIDAIENPELVKKMGLNGINTVKDNFTIEKYAESVNNYIITVANRHGKTHLKNIIDVNGLTAPERSIADFYNNMFLLPTDKTEIADNNNYQASIESNTETVVDKGVVLKQESTDKNNIKGKQMKNNKIEEAIETGDYTKAIQLLQVIINEDPSDTEALNNLAVVLSILGEKDSAVRALNLVLKVDPQNQVALENLKTLAV